MKVLSVDNCYVKLNEKFNKKGKDLERRDFYAILAHILNVSLLEAKTIKYVNANVYRRVKKYATKLLTGMPIQYAINSANFCGIDLYVDNSVLIPRFDSENVVPEVVKVLLNNDKVLDMCTGSGALGIAVAKMAEEKEIEIDLTLSDISDKALAVAKKNCYKNYVRANYILSDLFDNIDGTYDVIICNPPYVTEEEYLNLEPMVRDFEPKLALVGGVTGYEYYERIVKDLKNHLGYKGKIFFEIGKGQEDYIKKLLIKDFRCIKIIKDLSGVNRFISAVKREDKE